MINRIFLELDPFPNDYLHDCIPTPITEITGCSESPLETWEAILKADEIYFSSQFFTNGQSDISSSGLFNMLMAKAIQDDIKGKKVFLARKFEDVAFSRVATNLFNETFSENNSFFVLSDGHETEDWQQLKSLRT